MNQLTTLAYTAIGGAIGAGLNQYVTNIGQRRTARAAVVSKVLEAEAIYAKLRWPNSISGGADSTHDLRADLERCLYELEGAGLVAGISQKHYYWLHTSL